jgi:hypothetical protein
MDAGHSLPGRVGKTASYLFATFMLQNCTFCMRQPDEHQDVHGRADRRIYVYVIGLT